MNAYKRLEIRIDAGSARVLDARYLNLREDRNAFEVIAGETVILCFRFYDLSVSRENIISAVEHPLPDSMSYALIGAESCLPDSPAVFAARSGDGLVNRSGDWFQGGSADFARGELSFVLDSNNRAFADMLGGQGQCRGWFGISGIPAGESKVTVLAVGNFLAVNCPGNGIETGPEISVPEYYTADQVDALLAGAAGGVWHRIQEK